MIAQVARPLLSRVTWALLKLLVFTTDELFFLAQNIFVVIQFTNKPPHTMSQQLVNFFLFVIDNKAIITDQSELTESYMLQC